MSCQRTFKSWKTKLDQTLLNWIVKALVFGLSWWNLKYVFTAFSLHSLVFINIPLPNFRVSWLGFVLQIDRILAKFSESMSECCFYICFFSPMLLGLFLPNSERNSLQTATVPLLQEKSSLPWTFSFHWNAVKEDSSENWLGGHNQLNVTDKIMKRQFIIHIKRCGW